MWLKERDYIFSISILVTVSQFTYVHIPCKGGDEATLANLATPTATSSRYSMFPSSGDFKPGPVDRIVIVSTDIYIYLNNLVTRQKGKANKSTTPRTAVSFQRKEELPWVVRKETGVHSY